MKYRIVVETDVHGRQGWSAERLSEGGWWYVGDTLTLDGAEACERLLRNKLKPQIPKVTVKELELP